MTSVEYCTLALSIMQQQPTFTNVNLTAGRSMIPAEFLPTYTARCYCRLTPTERTVVERDVAYFEARQSLEIA